MGLTEKKRKACPKTGRDLEINVCPENSSILILMLTYQWFPALWIKVYLGDGD